MNFKEFLEYTAVPFAWVCWGWVWYSHQWVWLIVSVIPYLILRNKS